MKPLYKSARSSLCRHATPNCGKKTISTFNQSSTPDLQRLPHENATHKHSFNFWKSLDHQKQYFDDLGKQIGIQKLDDWYLKLSTKLLQQNRGYGLLECHNGSPSLALISAYPEHNWIPWKFTRVSQGFWKSLHNQRRFFDWVGKELGINQLDDWYHKLSQKAIADNGGGTLITLYNRSPIDSLMAAFPEHNWVPWKFNCVPHGFWKSQDNHRKYFDWLGNQLGIKELDDWYYKLSQKALIQNHGGSLLTLFNGSPIDALMSVYPYHNWIPWKFNFVPNGFWKSIENQRLFFNWLGNQLQVKDLDDWYEKLSWNVIQQHGGSTICKLYNGSPISTLKAVYPEHKWISWKFNNVPMRFWNSENNVREFLLEISQKLSIQTLDDWYRVDTAQLQKFGAWKLLKNGGLHKILEKQYPHHTWDPKKFARGKKAQRWLLINLQKIFPNEEILEDYVHPKVVLPSSNRPMQLDMFIPAKSLAFEYQGQQHYQQVGVFQPLKTYQQRDEEKRVLCASNNIKLIEIPYWWNRTQESLQEIINQS